MAIGLPALPITIVSPAAASSSNRESCVLAYCTFTVFTRPSLVWSEELSTGAPDRRGNQPLGNLGQLDPDF